MPVKRKKFNCQLPITFSVLTTKDINSIFHADHLTKKSLFVPRRKNFKAFEIFYVEFGYNYYAYAYVFYETAPELYNTKLALITISRLVIRH